MDDAEARLSKRLADLGWHSIDSPTTLTNVLWLYLSAGLDPTAPLRAIEYHGARDGDRARAGCLRALSSMLDVADCAGRLDVLRRPQVRTPEKVLMMLQRLSALTSGARPEAHGRAGGSGL